MWKYYWLLWSYLCSQTQFQMIDFKNENLVGILNFNFQKACMKDDTLTSCQSLPTYHSTFFNLHFQKVQKKIKTHSRFLKLILCLQNYFKNSLNYKQAKILPSKGKPVYLYSSYPSGMRDHKSKCGHHNEFTTNVNTNLFLPREYFCYRYYH